MTMYIIDPVAQSLQAREGSGVYPDHIYGLRFLESAI